MLKIDEYHKKMNIGSLFRKRLAHHVE